MKNALYIGFLCAVLVVVLCEPALAAKGGLPYETWLETFQNSVTGPVAGGLMLAGIVGAGAMLIMGGEVGTFLKTMVYIILVGCFLVGATALYSDFFGEAKGYTLTDADRIAVVSFLEPGD